MMNTGDYVFEKIAEDLYVMVANRFDKVDDLVYSGAEIMFMKEWCKVEIRGIGVQFHD